MIVYDVCHLNTGIKILRSYLACDEYSLRTFNKWKKHQELIALDVEAGGRKSSHKEEDWWSQHRSLNWPSVIEQKWYIGSLMMVVLICWCLLTLLPTLIVWSKKGDT